MTKTSGTLSDKLKSCCFLWSSFDDPALEKLYQSYSVKQKRAGLECFLITAVLFDIYMLVVPNDQDLVTFGVISIFLLLNCSLLIWCKRGVQKCGVWSAVPHVAWHIANAQLLASLFLKKTKEMTSRDNLGWVLLLDYLIYVTLPLRLRYCVMLSMGTCACYLSAIIGLGKPNEEVNVVEQVSVLFFVLYVPKTEQNILFLCTYRKQSSIIMCFILKISLAVT